MPSPPPGTVHAQSAPPTGTNKASDVVVLSPFEVVSQNDSGYVPPNDVSGNRLNTVLRDVAAPINRADE